jgi:hypothetical protein
MRRVSVAAAALVTLSACGPPPPAAPSRDYSREIASAQQAQVAQNNALIEASAARAHASVEAMQAQAAAAAATQKATLDDANAAAVARLAGMKAEQREARRRTCETTRSVRAADAQHAVLLELVFAKEVTSRSKEIHAACKLAVTNTGAVRVESTSRGFRASAEKKDSVVCRGGVPKGLREYDVWLLLERESAGAVDDSGVPYATESQYSAENTACREDDLAVNLDTQVTPKDGRAAAKALVDWKPTSAAP